MRNMKKLIGFRQEQERKAAIVLLSVFYFVFIIYEIFLRTAGLHEIIVPENKTILFFHLQLFLYTALIAVLPVAIYFIRKHDSYKVKYILFSVYMGTYIIYEILVYSLIEMDYITANIADMIFILLAPIFVNKVYFRIVFFVIMIKIMTIAFITGNPLVLLGVFILFFMGIVAYIILKRYLLYLEELNQLFVNEIEVEMYKTIAYKDDLTGTYSKRFINIELSELNNAKEKNIGLVILDIDEFKIINDSYNHNVGDQAIKAFVGIVQEELDFEDLIGRYGGDEFVLILKNKSYHEIIEKIECIKNKIENAEITVDFQNAREVIHVTGSFGVYYLHQNDPKSPSDALVEADNLLIGSKNKGKNQINSN